MYPLTLGEASCQHNGFGGGLGGADGIGGPEGGGAPGGMGEQNGTPEAFMPLSYVVISELLNRVHCVTMGSLPPSVTSEAVLVNSFHLKYLKVQPWQAPNA